MDLYAAIVAFAAEHVNRRAERGRKPVFAGRQFPAVTGGRRQKGDTLRYTGRAPLICFFDPLLRSAFLNPLVQS